MSRMQVDKEGRRRLFFWGRLIFALAAGTLFGWLAWESPESTKSENNSAGQQSLLAKQDGLNESDSQEANGLTGLYKQAGVRQVWANKQEEKFAEPSAARTALEKRLNSADRWSGEQPEDDAVRQAVVHSRSPPDG